MDSEQGAQAVDTADAPAVIELDGSGVVTGSQNAEVARTGRRRRGLPAVIALGVVLILGWVISAGVRQHVTAEYEEARAGYQQALFDWNDALDGFEAAQRALWTASSAARSYEISLADEIRESDAMSYSAVEDLIEGIDPVYLTIRSSTGEMRPAIFYSMRFDAGTLLDLTELDTAGLVAGAEQINQASAQLVAYTADLESAAADLTAQTGTRQAELRAERLTEAIDAYDVVRSELQALVAEAHALLEDTAEQVDDDLVRTDLATVIDDATIALATEVDLEDPYAVNGATQGLKSNLRSVTVHISTVTQAQAAWQAARDATRVDTTGLSGTTETSDPGTNPAPRPEPPADSHWTECRTGWHDKALADPNPNAYNWMIFYPGSYIDTAGNTWLTDAAGNLGPQTLKDHIELPWPWQAVCG